MSFRNCFAVCLSLGFFALGGTPTWARSLDEATSTIATTVSKYVVSEGATKEINIEVTGPKQASNQLVQRKLQELFEKQGFKINALASWTLSVKIRISNQSTPTTTLSIEVLDLNGNTKDDFDEFFDVAVGEEAATSDATAAATTTSAASTVEKKPDTNDSGKVDLPVNNAPEAPRVQGQNVDFTKEVEKVTGKSPGELIPVRAKIENNEARREQIAEVQKAVKEKIKLVSTSPTFSIAPSPVEASQGSLSVLRPESSSKFGLEVLKSSSSQGPFVPVTVEKKSGQPFVSLDEGDFIQIRAYNDSGFPVGLELIIDGVNSLDLSTSPAIRSSGKWILNPGMTKGAVIGGWFKDAKTLEQFIITSEPNGVAARFGLNHKIGTIQANFYLAWDETQQNSNTIPLFAALCNSEHDAPGDNAFGSGPDIQFAGSIKRVVFDKGFSLATITLLHENPQNPRLALPAGAPAGAGAAAPVQGGN